jgi:hypothetical protein
LNAWDPQTRISSPLHLAATATETADKNNEEGSAVVAQFPDYLLSLSVSALKTRELQCSTADA